MPPRKRPASPDLSRLTLLAAGDQQAFATYAAELLRSRDRLASEAALAALVERPLESMREQLRDLYLDLDADGPKRDTGATTRSLIVRVMAKFGDARDRDLAMRAASTSEIVFGSDTTWTLRAQGLGLLADLDPALFPYFAVEHLEDRLGVDGEPARTAFRLLAATGHYVPIYQWLVAGEPPPGMMPFVFEQLSSGPREIVQRYAERAMQIAIRRQDEALGAALAEAIVDREIEGCYDAVGDLMAAKVSDELYNYLAVLFARTNRPALLAILERQLHSGRRAGIVAAALRIRTTPEQAAILRRWEAGEGE